MKTTTYILIFFVGFLQTAFAQTQRLNELLYAKQYPQLQKELQSTKLSSNNKMLYEAFVANAFNQPAVSNKLIGMVKDIKNDTLEYHLNRIQYDNHVKLNDYKSAYAASEKLVSHYNRFLTAEELKDQKDESEIWKFLVSSPPQKIIKNTASVIPLTKDLAGLWNIPVTMNEQSHQFVFDTGAGISVITATYAQLLNVDIIPESAVNIQGGVNGINNLSKLGIAKELKIGNITIQNALFLVFPDSALSFANGAYVINGIIGLPIIKELGEIKITESQMEIPLKASKKTVEKNLVLDLLQPVIYMKYQNHTLPFTFDTGAQSSLFSNNFYNRFGKELNGTKKNVAIGGAGGTKDMPIVEVPELLFEINSNPIRFKNSQISIDTLPANAKEYYGNIGQDLIRQFASMTINFDTSTIVFENTVEQD